MTATAHKWSYVFEEPTRILVVDDDPILHEFAVVHLTAPLSQVETAPNALAGLDLLSRAEFDIVMVDIEMPGMDGIEMVQRIRADEKLRRLPLVMVTGREDIVSIDRAYEAGATSFVTKPINWRQLSYQLRCIVRANKWAREVRAERASAVANAALPAPMREEFERSLNAIIDQAGLIAGDNVPNRDAAHAGEIAALAQSLLHKLATGDGASLRDPHAMQLGLQQLTGSAC